MKKTELKRGGGNLKRTPLKRSSSLSSRKGPRRGRGVSPASTEQREKRDSVWLCRVCKTKDGYGLDPAHVIDRSVGGCDEAACVVPLCRLCHNAYDEGTPQLDLLPYLTLEEQAHAVGHLGLTRALRRITGERHIAESDLKDHGINERGMAA